MRRKQLNGKDDKMKQKKGRGLNETILGWFKRVHPEELWAVGKMPPKLTFEDVRKSMEAGDSMGEAERHSDTMTREMILDRLAKLCGKGTDELIGWCNAKFREKLRSEYREKHPRARKPAVKKLRDLAGAAEAAVRDLADALRGIDCLALGDRLGKDGIAEFRSTFYKATSLLSDADGVLSEAAYLL